MCSKMEEYWFPCDFAAIEGAVGPLEGIPRVPRLYFPFTAIEWTKFRLLLPHGTQLALGFLVGKGWHSAPPLSDSCVQRIKYGESQPLHRGWHRVDCSLAASRIAMAAATAVDRHDLVLLLRASDIAMFVQNIRNSL